MKSENLQSLGILFDRFKQTSFFRERVRNTQFAGVAKSIISEVLESQSLSNEHLTAFIQIFKVNASITTIEKYLGDCKLDKIKTIEFCNQINSLEINGYTAAGRFAMKNLNQNQLDQIRQLLCSSYRVVSVVDAVTLMENFRNLNIPFMKMGIYSPWLHYINPTIFPIVNSVTKKFCEWLELSSDYPNLISEFQIIKDFLQIEDLGLLDGFIYYMNDTLGDEDKLEVTLFAMSIGDEKLSKIVGKIDNYENGTYSKILKDEFYFRNGSDENSNVQKFWLVGSAWTLEGDKKRSDMTSDFFTKGIWVNGFKFKLQDIVNSVKIGDKIAIKSVFYNKGSSVMRIKAIGTVIDNPKDGRNLKVDWVKNFTQFDLDFTGGYWSTISESKKEHIERIWV